jgi:hypothetical protein
MELKEKISISITEHAPYDGSPSLEAMIAAAGVLEDNDDLSGARDVFVFVWQTLEATKGIDHDDTRRVLEHAANASMKLMETAKAIDLFDKLLSTRLRSLGVDHPATTDARIRLASLLEEDDDSSVKMQRAEGLYQEALTTRLAAVSATSKSSIAAVITVASYLGRNLKKQGRETEAVVLWGRLGLLPVNCPGLSRVKTLLLPKVSLVGEGKEEVQPPASTVASSASHQTSSEPVASELSHFETQQLSQESLNLAKLLGCSTPRFDEVISTHMSRMQPGSRQWMKNLAHSWMDAQQASEEPSSLTKMLCLRAEAGMGKTAFTAWLVAYYGSRRRVVSAVFSRFGDKQTTDASNICKSIALQIAINVPGTLEPIAAAWEALQTKGDFGLHTMMQDLIVSPLAAAVCPSHLGPSESMVMIFDALDEVGAPRSDSRNAILKFFQGSVRLLPDWVKVFVTSRPEEDLVTGLSQFHPVVIAADDPRHLQDLNQFAAFTMQSRLLNPNELAAVTALLMVKSEGRFGTYYF